MRANEREFFIIARFHDSFAQGGKQVRSIGERSLVCRPRRHPGRMLKHRRERGGESLAIERV